MKNKLRLKSWLLVSLLVLISGCSSQDPALAEMQTFIAAKNIDKSKGDWKTNLPKPPELEFADDTEYVWQLTTSEGPITLKLFAQQAPMHVSSTIYLTQLGFYNGLTFHRVIPDFMAQGGDPLGIGAGNPGYRYAGEFEANLSHYKAGILSMANAGPFTDGSQFFITFKPTQFLDGRHTVFGEVIDGFETLDKFKLLGSASGKTKQPIVIEQATIQVQ